MFGLSNTRGAAFPEFADVAPHPLSCPAGSPFPAPPGRRWSYSSSNAFTAAARMHRSFCAWTISEGYMPETLRDTHTSALKPSRPFSDSDSSSPEANSPLSSDIEISSPFSTSVTAKGRQSSESTRAPIQSKTSIACSTLYTVVAWPVKLTLALSRTSGLLKTGVWLKPVHIMCALRTWSV